jgi:glyoxylase-like metal-dependent hydrolase (beta-lactamase superfamily II)
MTKSLNHHFPCPASFRLDGGAMYGIIPKPLWQKHSPPDELNRIELALRLWLIESDDRLVLIDTGVGDYHGEQFEERFAVKNQHESVSPALIESLATLGKTPDQITDLVISHLHFDHAGGMAKLEDDKLVPTFPKARLHLHKDHYAYALNPTQRDIGSFHQQIFTPIIETYKSEGLVVFHSGSAGELIHFAKENQTLRFRCSHGHTPWLMHPYTDEYIYLADLIPTTHHVPIPWVMGYDIAPGQTTIDKQAMLEFVAANQLTVIFEHDIDFWGATIEACPKRGYKIAQAYSALPSSSRVK